IVGSNYVVTDTATTITLTAAAKAAGWSGSGSNSVTGPTAGVTGLSLATSSGADAISKLVAGVPTTISSLGTLTFTGPGSVAGSLGISGPTTLAVQGDVEASGAVSVSSVTDISGVAAGKLGGTSVTLSASHGVGA